MTATIAPPTPVPTRNAAFALLVLSASQFMVVLDGTITNVALPSIQSALHFSLADLQWVVNLYTLTFGGTLLLAGRIADSVGRRRIFIGGLLLFALASLLGGFAQTSAWLVAARGLQGLGAASISATALAILTTTFPAGPQRNRALGIWGGIAAVGAAVGVTLGGVLTSGLSWRWVLFVNVPVGLFAIALTPFAVPESRAPQGAGFDLAGAGTITAGLAALVYALVRASTAGWSAASTLVPFAVALGLLVAFVLIERRAQTPLVPLSVFRDHSLTGANLAGLAIPIGPVCGFYFISLYLQQVLGYSALRTGLAFLPFALTALVVSLFVCGRLLNRFGSRSVLVAGMAIIAVGLLLLTEITVQGRYVAVVLPGTVVIATGMMLAFSASAVAATASGSGEQAGLFSGLINTASQIGNVIGLAVLTTVVTGWAAPLDGFHAAFFTGAGLEIVGALIAFAFVRGAQPALAREAVTAALLRDRAEERTYEIS